jgi:hypothetical protein
MKFKFNDRSSSDLIPQILDFYRAGVLGKGRTMARALINSRNEFIALREARRAHMRPARTLPSSPRHSSNNKFMSKVMFKGSGTKKMARENIYESSL